MSRIAIAALAAAGMLVGPCAGVSGAATSTTSPCALSETARTGSTRIAAWSRSSTWSPGGEVLAGRTARSAAALRGGGAGTVERRERRDSNPRPPA